LLSQVSLSKVRDSFLHGWIGVDGVLEYYRLWLAIIFYVICVRFNYSKGEFEYRAFRGVKRGDDKYSFLTCQKVKRLGRFGNDLVYFNRGSHGHVKGSGLLWTLEYNANVISVGNAWQNVGVDFNRSMSHIRKLFGNFSLVRVWESHESGYPHIHVLLIFHNYVFGGRRMYSQTHKKWLFRVIGSDYKALKGCWCHGFSDSEMVDSYQGGVRYLSKYLVKSTSLKEAGSKGGKTLAMCWLFHRRSFSISGELFSDEISILCNSNLNSTKENSDVRFLKIGIDLYGNSIFEKVGKWHLFGFCLRETVLWPDWRSHLVSPLKLVCVDDKESFGIHKHYEVLADCNNLGKNISKKEVDVENRKIDCYFCW
jgi:hypothetical protein